MTDSVPLTDEERFRFDLNGFLIRPAILSPEEVASIVDQIDGIAHDASSLPPEHRALPGGPASILIDHPQVLGVLHEVIDPFIRLDQVAHIWRESGARSPLHVHRGGPGPDDHVFGYRVHNGRIHAGMVRVIFELSDVSRTDGATSFLPGSHKVNFNPYPTQRPDEATDYVLSYDLSDSLVSYDCPAGSAVFFTEAVFHVGPQWRRETPRAAVLHAYSHLCTHYGRGTDIPPEVLAGLSPERRAYFRAPWLLDFSPNGNSVNTIERFVTSGEPPVDVDAGAWSDV